MSQHIKEAQAQAREKWVQTNTKDEFFKDIFEPEDLDTLITTTYHQARQQAFDEALELVGEDKKKDDTTIPKDHKNYQVALLGIRRYNQAKAELREALIAKKNV